MTITGHKAGGRNIHEIVVAFDLREVLQSRFELLHARFLGRSQSDVDLGRERPMNRTSGRDFHQFRVLFCG